MSKLLHYMQSCISDVKAWETANKLKLNDNKRELMLVTSKKTKHLHNLPTSISIGNAQIPFKLSVKNLGLTLDCHLTMNAHVSNIARTCYFELRSLASICRFLTSTATATLVSAFVLSIINPLDSCQCRKHIQNSLCYHCHSSTAPVLSASCTVLLIFFSLLILCSHRFIYL